MQRSMPERSQCLTTAQTKARAYPVSLKAALHHVRIAKVMHLVYATVRSLSRRNRPTTAHVIQLELELCHVAPLTRGATWSRFWSGANMKNLVVSCLALLAAASGAAAADKIRVLILTGESDYSHPWQP